MRDLVWIAAAGALGSLGRYAVSGWAFGVFGDRLPYGTLAVNAVGSLLLGVFMQLGLASELMPESARLAATVGFLGAFTTFSTFSYETWRFLEEGATALAVTNMGANLALGLGAVSLGLWLGRSLLGGA